MIYDILRLNEMLVPELKEIAEHLGIKGAKKMNKQDLVFQILDRQALGGSVADEKEPVSTGSNGSDYTAAKDEKSKPISVRPRMRKAIQEDAEPVDLSPNSGTEAKIEPAISKQNPELEQKQHRQPRENRDQKAPLHKMMMFERASGFVAMPGGIGTLEELAEILTWAQLQQHARPILLLNVLNFWAPLLTLLDDMRRDGFIRAGFEVNLDVVDHPQDIIPAYHHRLSITRDIAPVEIVKGKF